VISAVEKVNQQLATNPELLAQINELKRKLLGEH
jgi:hypothetical protein